MPFDQQKRPLIALIDGKIADKIKHRFVTHVVHDIFVLADAVDHPTIARLKYDIIIEFKSTKELQEWMEHNLPPPQPQCKKWIVL